MVGGGIETKLWTTNEQLKGDKQRKTGDTTKVKNTGQSICYTAIVP